MDNGGSVGGLHGQIGDDKHGWSGHRFDHDQGADHPKTPIIRFILDERRDLDGGENHADRHDADKFKPEHGSAPDWRDGRTVHFAGSPTISATRASSWHEEGAAGHRFLIVAGGLQTVGSGEGHNTSATLFGRHGSVAASAGNTTLHATISDEAEWSRFSHAIGSSMVGSGWSHWSAHPPFSIGPSVAAGFHAGSDKGVALSVGLTLSDNTKVTFTGYIPLHLKPGPQ